METNERNPNKINTLVIFTNELPCCGRSFLDDEIYHLSNAFSTVYIFATKANGQPEMVPNNVSLYNLHLQRNFFFKAIKFLFGFFCLFPKEKTKTFKQWVDKVFCKGNYAFCLYKINKIITKNHIHFENCLFYSYWLDEKALLALHFSNQCKSKGYKALAISRTHRGDLYDYATVHNYQPLQRFLVQQMDYIYACSSDGTNYLLKKYPEFKRKFSTSYLGTKDFGENPHRISDGFLFVTCSNLYKVKRVDVFAEAFVILSRQRKNIRWVCFGDGEERPKIEKIIKDSKTGGVQMMGAKPNSQILDFYKNTHVDFFVNVSSSEGLPVSIMEAMSFGIPCIATMVGGTSDLVNDRVGTLIPEEINPNQLACALCKAIDESESALLLKRTLAREKWQSTFFEKTAYQNWISTLKSIID